MRRSTSRVAPAARPPFPDPSPAGGAPTGIPAAAAFAPAVTALPGAMPSDVPHSLQKRALPGLTVAQRGQTADSFSPQLLQNLLPATLSAEQFGQISGIPRSAWSLGEDGRRRRTA